jgi:two-component system chemotaxis response regulator CheB
VTNRDVVVVGASAGGVEALRTLVYGLSPTFPASVVIVLHLARSAPSALPAILARATSLPVTTAIDGDQLRPGHVYVAPVDFHVLLLDGRLRLSRGPSENGHRPAIDPLFRSAALSFGPRTIGVILSGSRDDGAAGMAAIARQGGTTIVQDPEEALHSSMPLAAMEAARVDHILSVAKMGPFLGELVARVQPASAPAEAGQPAGLLAAEVEASESVPDGLRTIGQPAGYGCPACGGSLYEVEGSPVPRYRCRVGHAWSPESLLEEQSAGLEGALWMALRALADKAALSRRMAENFRASGHGSTRERFESIAADADSASELIRGLIDRIGANGTSNARPPTE